jgi:hypothetical protein
MDSDLIFMWMMGAGFVGLLVLVLRLAGWPRRITGVNRKSMRLPPF